MSFKTKYGYFQKGGREFVVTTPFTPTAWVNYLTNGEYTALITPTGGGYAWIQESGFNRILRENILDNLIADTPGRYVYIKDLDNEDYFSNTFQPVRKGEKFRAIQSLGWLKTENEYQGIQTETTFFVPLNSQHEVWQLKVRNNSDRPRHLRLTTYCEFVLGNFSHDILENSFASLFATSKKTAHSLLFTKKRWELPSKTLAYWDKWAFITSNVEFDQFEVSKKDFSGFGRSLANPVAMNSCNDLDCTQLHGLSSKEKTSENMIGALSFQVNLKPGEEKEFIFAVGVVTKTVEAETVHENIKKDGYAKKELAKINAFWDEYISKVWIETPDEGLNIWFNYWGKYQTWINANFAEMDSFYIGGRGVFGFRDTAQHIWAALPFDQPLYEKQLSFLLSHQFVDGSVPHAIRLVDDESIITEHSDDPCWLVFAVLNYLEETNDLGLLRKKITLAGEDKRSYRDMPDTVLDHLLKAVDYTVMHSSKNGLPLHRTADWNDALVGGHLSKGESLMVTGLFAFNLKRVISLLERIGLHKQATVYERHYDRLKKAVNKLAWDGKWYVRATTDHGEVIGSHKNKEGQIFLDSNTLLILSGLAGDRTDQVLKSLEKLLDTDYGPQIFTPAYTRENKDRGIISQFMPGAKENASIFSHPAAWYFIALAKSHAGYQALQLLKKMLPIYRYFRDPDLFQIEPYVFYEFAFGRESDKFGQGSFSWVTGSAEWFFRGILDYFFGLRPDYDKLVFHPKTPKNWSFKIWRLFQGKTYLAEYNKGKVSQLKVVPPFQAVKTS